jgi:hypothetical protein
MERYQRGHARAARIGRRCKLQGACSGRSREERRPRRRPDEARRREACPGRPGQRLTTDSRLYPYKVPMFQKRPRWSGPRSTVEFTPAWRRPRTRLEFARDIVWPIAVITLTALKLARVITWSWWWVLSPLWGGLALNIVAVGGMITIMICDTRYKPRPHK